MRMDLSRLIKSNSFIKGYPLKKKTTNKPNPKNLKPHNIQSTIDFHYYGGYNPRQWYKGLPHISPPFEVKTNKDTGVPGGAYSKSWTHKENMGCYDRPQGSACYQNNNLRAINTKLKLNSRVLHDNSCNNSCSQPIPSTPKEAFLHFPQSWTSHIKNYYECWPHMKACCTQILKGCI